jgi:hypothetical protein
LPDHTSCLVSGNLMAFNQIICALSHYATSLPALAN